MFGGNGADERTRDRVAARRDHLADEAATVPKRKVDALPRGTGSHHGPSEIRDPEIVGTRRHPVLARGKSVESERAVGPACRLDGAQAREGQGGRICGHTRASDRPPLRVPHNASDSAAACQPGDELLALARDLHCLRRRRVAVRRCPHLEDAVRYPTDAPAPRRVGLRVCDGRVFDVQKGPRDRPPIPDIDDRDEDLRPSTQAKRERFRVRRQRDSQTCRDHLPGLSRNDVRAG